VGGDGHMPDSGHGVGKGGKTKLGNSKKGKSSDSSTRNERSAEKKNQIAIISNIHCYLYVEYVKNSHLPEA
jgi:hypothetical protein